MQSQGEIVGAAEALRVWVRGQQAAWHDPADQIPVSPPVRSAPSDTPSVVGSADPPLRTAPPVAPPPQVGAVPAADFAPAAFAKWRQAAVVALVALVVGGGLLWQRGASAPRRGAAAFDSLPA